MDLDKNTSCNVSKQSAVSRLLRSKLIIWDEAPMCRRESIETLDKMMHDICDSESQSGGKVIVFCEAFR